MSKPNRYVLVQEDRYIFLAIIPNVEFPSFRFSKCIKVKIQNQSLLVIPEVQHCSVRASEQTPVWLSYACYFSEDYLNCAPTYDVSRMSCFN